ncbi:phosphocholine cytidylyltransferase family protein [Sporosarcina sp. FSL K6-5500]|uniref:phosphocholine cytidylyltransferase family protein n=1 Tax=Sporosarcina sp. FSL K6-5500 TaxID=2921558 RepID=UPI0030F66DC3
MIKKAVIVAAGLSSRLYPLTLETPKTLLKVNEEEILMRNISLLKEHGVEEIFIVVGYRKEDIMNKAKGQAQFIFNPFYKYCNNMGSLWFAKSAVNDDPFYYLHGDIIFSEELLKDFIEQTKDSLAVIDLSVDFKETNEEAMKVRVTDKNTLIESNKEIVLEQSDGEWIGIAAIKNPDIVFTYIEKALTEEHYNVYDTFAFTNMAQDGLRLYCVSTNNEPWIEVDFLEDYEKAKEIFK